MKSQKIENLRRLAEKRLKRKIVLCDGSPEAKIMLIGEAPGRQEEILGRPFVGQAGRLLNKALAEAGLKRDSVYITNIVLWRPPDNRKPLKKEIEICRPYLIKQLEIVKPKIICTLGNTALNFFIKDRKITKTHGKIIKTRIGGLRLLIIPTFHPAAILYNRKLQQLFENDMKCLADMGQSPSYF